jgi:GNAT superfamily N-acetyltransferase
LHEGGPGRFLWRICRKILSPIISAEAFFVFDTSLGDPVPAVCPAGIEVHVYQGLENFEAVEAHIASMGVKRTVEARLGQGEAVAIATDGIRAVGFSWVAFSDFWAADFEMRVAIPPLYICHSDVFVRPEWRGRGINPLMVKVSREFARSRGRERAVSQIIA